VVTAACGEVLGAATLDVISVVSEVPVIAVRVLGPMEVIVNGVPVNVGGPRQRCVLARLIAAHGEVVPAGRLVEDLYAGDAPPRAHAAVQSYVSRLRRALEPGRAAWARAGILVASPPGYAVRLGDGTVDAWSFEEEVRQAAGLDDPAAVHARLSAALARWHGGAFEEFGGLPWADLEASRLEELRLAAMEARADTALRLGRAAQTVADLERLTAQHPLREEAWRLLALALYQSGRQGDALGALRRVREMLAEELGVDPGPALRDLERDILAQEPHLSTQANRPGAAVNGPGAPVMDVPCSRGRYVGRDAELARTLRAAAEAARGRRGIVLVTGEAGAGKTALAGQVSQRLAAEGWVVAVGRCPEHDGAPAGWPWAGALRRLARAVPSIDSRPLAALLDGDRAPGDDVAAARFRLRQAISQYLDAVSRAAPLLLVLDDLHRADSETLAILTDVTAGPAACDAASPAAERVLVLATYRPAEAGERLDVWLAALAGRQPVRIALRGLDEAAAGELIRATCARPVDDATVRIIADRTGGNPFFLKETARLLDSDGAERAVTEVPAGVREVLRHRIAALPAAARTLLLQTSVIGAEAEASVLAEVADVEESVLLEALDGALRAELVTEPAPGRIRFAHALVRDTLYESLSRLRRSRLHAEVAAVIERRSPGDMPALAHHFALAGTDPAKAARYCGLAAGQAEQRFDFHEAARLREQALEFLDQVREPDSEVPGADARDRLELVLGLVRALSHDGQLAIARSLRKHAVRAALQLNDPALVAKVVTALDVPRALFFREYGETDPELVGVAERLIGELPAGDHPLRCRLLTTLAIELEDAETERGYRASAQAVAMARRLGDPALLTMALIGRWTESFRFDGPDERLRIGGELLMVSGKQATAEAAARAILMSASCGIADFRAADWHAAEAARIAARYQLPPIEAAVSMYRAMRTALNGDPAAAAERYQGAARQLGRFGLRVHGAAVDALATSALLIMQNRTAEIAAQHFLAGWFPELYALGLAAAGQGAEARSVVGRPLPLRHDRAWLFLTGVRGLLGIAVDDRERARSAYDALLPYAAQPAGTESMLVPCWPTAQILGDLARHLGLPGADAHYRDALAIGERAGVQPWRDAATNRLS
jgi:DNA-binding SARP family transcriptional activator